MNKILIVAAHPDDEVLGCGGTIARFVNEGNVEVATLILGEGGIKIGIEKIGKMRLRH